MIFKKNKHPQFLKNKAHNYNLENYKFAKIKPFGIKLPINQLNPRAFSLLEMSLVLIIISVILSSGLNIATSNLKNSKNNVTKERIKEIYKNLGVFLATEKRLPCPSSLKLKESDANYGNESLNSYGNCTNNNSSPENSFVSSSNGNIIIGGIPNKALNLGSDFAKDGFGNRLFYVVDKNFISVGGAKVVTDDNFVKINENGSILTISKARLIIYSTGANSKGAVVASNATKITKSTDADEAENDVPLVNSSTNIIDFNDVLVSSSAGNENFDDIMFYRTRNQILQDANLLDLLECPTFTENIAYGLGADFTWLAAKYNEIVPSLTSCPSTHLKGVLKPTKRCGLFGLWQEGVIDPCQN